MPPELTVVLIGIAVAAGAGIQQLIKAVVKRQVGKMEADAAEALKDREIKRQMELESLREKTAKAQEDAAQAKAIGENLINLNATVIRLIDSHTKERFADREVLSNQIETVGNLSESVDRIAEVVNENTSATRTTGAKADSVVAAIEHLELIMSSGVAEIKLLLTPPPPPTNVVNVNTGTPADKPAMADGEAA